MQRPVALAASPPQKNVGAVTCPIGSSQTRGCRLSGANPLVARVAGDPLVLQIGDGSTEIIGDRPRFPALLHISHGLITARPVAWNGATSRVATVKARAAAVAAM